MIIGIDFGVTFRLSRSFATRDAAESVEGCFDIATRNGSREVQVTKQWSGGGRQLDLLEKVTSRFAPASENSGLREDA